MAMVGSVMSSAPHANDLHGFLAKANLERFYYRLEHELKLDSVSRLRELNDFSELVEMGMTKKDIGNLRKYLKKEDHPSGTFSLLRNKSKPVKSVSAVVQNPPSTGKTTQRTNMNYGCQFDPAKVGNCSSCEQSSGSTAKYEIWQPQESCCNRCQCTAKTNYSRTPEKRGALKRSMSAATDHVPSCHPLDRVQSTAHPSCMDGQRLALWHDDTKGNSEFSKRLSLRIDDPRQRTSSEKSQTGNKDSESLSAMDEVLTVLGGSPPFSRPESSNPPSLTDLSPLIELDKPSFGNSFDNVAATENSSISRNSSEGGLPAHADGEPIKPVQKLPPAGARHSEGKKRKWFPQLRVKIPDNDNVRLSPKLNIKKLTAAEERRIDEALELAGTFARLGTSEHCASTPRTPGASSKESKESLSSTESPTSHFRFGLFKMRKEEKKTFVEELASHLTDPSSLLTPEALDAYEKLVAKSGLDKDDSGNLKSRHAKQSARQAHRLSLRMKLFRHVHPQRSSLSESDSSVPPERKSPENVTGHSRSMRFGSTGRTLKNPSDKQNLFTWFDKSPLNSSMKQEENPRPKSLQSNFHIDARVNKFPITMPPHSAPICVPMDAAAPKTAGTRRTPPPPPVDEFCPPPAVPPRVPLRRSTVNAKPRQRHHPLPSGTTDKKRCYSEGTTLPDGARLNLPRREVRSISTDDGHSLSAEPHSTTGLNQLNSTHGSNDSVFDHRSPGPTTSQGVGSGGAGTLGQYRSLSVKIGKVSVEQLGISDKNDPFWIKNATLDLSECHSESDLLREALTPIPGRYETSDCISYEDLMEFALENRRDTIYRGNDVCDEIRVMRKMFSNDVTVDDCMKALVETSWDIHSAVKLVRLKQLLSAGLGTQEQCKEALMASNWDADEAASFLLASSSE